MTLINLADLAFALAMTGMAAVPPAGVGTPAPSWTNERVLQCDGQSVQTYLTPAGFGTPFHVVEDQSLIIPKYVLVVLPSGEGPLVTVDVPGFDRAGDEAVHCIYVDPLGLRVEFWGLRL